MIENNNKVVETFNTYKDFCKFVMSHEGELSLRKTEIYENGVLIGMMIKKSSLTGNDLRPTK